MRSTKILIVDDFAAFRGFVRSALQQRAEFQIAEASDGLEAVQKAAELLPDLILLDVGLPRLNGLEVARRVDALGPVRILFLSGLSDPEVAREALRLGAGYVRKEHAESDLLPAVEAVLHGQRFVGKGLDLGGEENPEAPAKSPHRHEILFCSDDDAVLEGLTRFIAAALNDGNAAIVWATESHRASLLQRLRAQSVDIDGAIRRGTYVSSDVAEPPDPARMAEALRALRAAASAVAGAKLLLTRSAGAEDCPDEGAVATELSRRLGASGDRGHRRGQLGHSVR